MSFSDEARVDASRHDRNFRDRPEGDRSIGERPLGDQPLDDQPFGDQRRAADALDRLVRGADTSARRPWPLAWPAPGSPRWLVAGLAGLAVTLVVVVVVTQRRPPPVDDRLPMADAAATTVAPDDSNGGTAAPASSPDAGAAPTSLGSDARIVVHVAGAVSSPGVVELPASSRVVDAVQAAGGLRADADPDRVNLAAPLTDGQRVAVPVVGQPLLPEPVSGSGSAGSGSGTAGSGAPGPGDTPDGLVDLNTADATQLDELPGVGPSTAAAIISHREKEGPFTSVDGLLDVRGIGEAKLEALRDLVTVGG